MKKIALVSSLIVLLVSCKNNSEEVVVVEQNLEEVEVIDTYEKRVAQIEKFSDLLQRDTLNFNKEYGEALLEAYKEFIEHHDLEMSSIGYTFQAGELSRALGKPHEAIRFFNLLIL